MFPSMIPVERPPDYQRPPSRPSSQAGGGRQGIRRRRRLYDNAGDGDAMTTRPKVRVQRKVGENANSNLLTSLPAAMRANIGLDNELGSGGGGSLRDTRRNNRQTRYNDFTPSVSGRKRERNKRNRRSRRGATTAAAIFGGDGLPSNLDETVAPRRDIRRFDMDRPYSRNRGSGLRKGRAQTSYATTTTRRQSNSSGLTWGLQNRTRNEEDIQIQASTESFRLGHSSRKLLPSTLTSTPPVLEQGSSWGSDLLRQAHQRRGKSSRWDDQIDSATQVKSRSRIELSNTNSGNNRAGGGGGAERTSTLGRTGDGIVRPFTEYLVSSSSRIHRDGGGGGEETSHRTGSLGGDELQLQLQHNRSSNLHGSTISTSSSGSGRTRRRRRRRRREKRTSVGGRSKQQLSSTVVVENTEIARLAELLETKGPVDSDGSQLSHSEPVSNHVERNFQKHVVLPQEDMDDFGHDVDEELARMSALRNALEECTNPRH